MFLTVMVIGLVGLVMMALPAMGGHGHLPPGMHGHGHAGGLGHHGAHAGHLAHGNGHPAAPSASEPSHVALAAAARDVGRGLIPSPRAVFSLLALYGAGGNALVHAAHLTGGHAALVAIGPAFLIERLLIRPVWNLVFRFQADASSPLEELVLAEAHAVVPFRNGRGLVTTVRDGRRVQLSARLSDQDAAFQVGVGQRLRIEDVDARRERVTVSVLPSDKSNPNSNPT